MIIAWDEKVKFGMQLIVEGCQEQKDWTKCHEKCPFDRYCTALMRDGLFDGEEFEDDSD